MNLAKLEQTIQTLLDITESADRPMRGPYQAKPRVSIVNIESPGYSDLSTDFFMAATRPLIGEQITGMNPEFYYPCANVNVDFYDLDALSDNIANDATFIVALDKNDFKLLCEYHIEPKHLALYQGLSADKQENVLETIAKKQLRMNLLETVLSSVQEVRSKTQISAHTGQDIEDEEEPSSSPAV